MNTPIQARSTRGTTAERFAAVPTRNAEWNGTPQTRAGYSFAAERLVERCRNVPFSRSTTFVEGGTAERPVVRP